MDIIKIIIKALNQINVHGKDDLDRLLACIQGLERLDKALEEAHNNGDQDKPEQNVHGEVDRHVDTERENAVDADDGHKKPVGDRG